MRYVKRGNEETIMDVVLRNMDMTGKSVKAWFSEDYYIKDLDKACRLCAKYRKLPINIVADYDDDGITSAAILTIGLKETAFEKVYCYIPKRFSQGYGINRQIVDQAIMENGKGLLIVVDNGIKAFDALYYAKEKGFDIIILDHHEAEIDAFGSPILPKLMDSDVIIDPKAIPGSAKFSYYCGAGLSYRFIKNLVVKLDPERDNVLLALAAMGTMGDVVPLREENYVLARKGLNAMKNGIVSNGLGVLLKSFDLLGHVTSTDVGFKLVPSINALERMHDGAAIKGVELLTKGLPGDPVSLETINLTNELIENNTKRKEATASAKKMADDILLNKEMKAPIFLYIPNLNEGICGLVASDVAEKHHLPAFVLTDSEEPGILKGSGRSYTKKDQNGNEHYINIYSLLEQNSDLLYAYGGHNKAAGLSIKKDMLSEVENALISSAEGLSYENDDFYYDLEIDAKDLSKTISEQLKFEPFGEGNDKIIYKIKNFTCIPNPKCNNKTVTICSDGKTVRLIGKDMSAIGFDTLSLFPSDDVKNVTLYGEISYNYFNGSCKPQIMFSGVEIE